MAGGKKKHTMLRAEEVDVSSIEYKLPAVKAPHMTGFLLRLFVWLVEAPLLRSIILSVLKRQNGIPKMLENTVIPEPPMFRPEFPPQAPEPGVVDVDEDKDPRIRVESALECLPPYDPSQHWSQDNGSAFLYWTVRDYAHAYRSNLATPTTVAERVISVVEDFNEKKPSMPLLISFDAEDVRKQATASTQRFLEGKPLSILDGIFMAIKDDVDCYPHPTKGGTTWLHKIRMVKGDAVCVSRLRSCGVILIGKANMHELGMGVTGNNPNYGTVRNPHSTERYTGGSSSGPAAIVACGLCPAALGTDGGGSIRIPSSLCGVVGLKTTFGRTDIKGSICDGGTVEVVAPLAATVEDIMLVYSAMSGSSPADRISLKPPSICLPNLSSSDNIDILGSLKLGKYTEWFNDVFSSDISGKCSDALNMLSNVYGCHTVEIILPELNEMRNAHLVAIGSETLCSLNPDYKDGRRADLTLDTRTSFAVFQSFTAADYVAAQRLRRRLMFYHMEVFKKVDFIVTPTTGMTAPEIPSSSLKYGESSYEVSGCLMRFVMAANLLGLPAISIPVGHDKQGLPIGLQLIGRPWGEGNMLRVASAIEELCLGSRRRPSTFNDILKGI
uniref:Fatty acid amide hydrolase n=1 Tax=Anthurium amnicola TaxID=1678845 RepID=A0A1D1XPP9_9ARAE